MLSRGTRSETQSETRNASVVEVAAEMNVSLDTPSPVNDSGCAIASKIDQEILTTRKTNIKLSWECLCENKFKKKMNLLL